MHSTLLDGGAREPCTMHVGNPEGGWEDEDYMFEALWEEEAWDDSGAY